MKTQKRQLQLNKETIKVLSGPQLSMAVGGGGTIDLATQTVIFSYEHCSAIFACTGWTTGPNSMADCWTLTTSG